MAENYRGSTKKIISLIAGPLSFILILLVPISSDLNAESQSVLACTAWIAIWWITEAIPIPVTSLLPIILLLLTVRVVPILVFMEQVKLFILKAML